MSKILKNNTNSEVPISDTGVSISASGQYTIQEQDFSLWAASDNLITLIGNDTITVNDGSFDLSKSDGINLIKGLYPQAQTQDTDTSGRQILRIASTIKGWHYQAHAVEFQTSKLTGIYNKDKNGNDLGYATTKFYDANGTELTTQIDIDASCVKTTLTWSPDYDFEMVAGNLRQINRQDTDIYVYVEANVLVAPNTYIDVPFLQGGINMRYIGADEPLKTDGRSSKLFTSNDKFSVICNHGIGVCHKVTIIFETYKSPV